MFFAILVCVVETEENAVLLKTMPRRIGRERKEGFEMIATQNAADKTQKFLDDFKVSKPVIGLPGLGWDTPEMAAAVSNAGGLGVLHIGFKTEEEIERDVAKVRSLTDKPFAVLMFPQKESILDAEKLRLQDTALSPLREDLGCTAVRPISAPLFDNQFRKIVELKVQAEIGRASCRERV